MPQKYNTPRISKKGSNFALFALLVLFIVFVIGIGFYVNKNSQKSESGKAVGGPKTNIQELNVQTTNESKKEKKKEEKKETKKEEVSAYQGNYFSVNYPKEWQAEKVNGATVNFSFSKNKKNNGEISINYKENKKGLPIERFYDGINDVNLFEDATGGFDRIKVGGNDAYKFKNLVGESPSAVLVIKLDKAFIEISDNYNAHQNDGVFDGFIESLKVK